MASLPSVFDIENWNETCPDQTKLLFGTKLIAHCFACLLRIWLTTISRLLVEVANCGPPSCSCNANPSPWKIIKSEWVEIWMLKKMRTRLTFQPTVRSMSTQSPCGFRGFRDGQRFGMTDDHISSQVGGKNYGVPYPTQPNANPTNPTTGSRETSPGFWFSPWMVRTSKCGARFQG